MTSKQIKLYINTIRYLRPIQIFGQIQKHSKMKRIRHRLTPQYNNIQHIKLYIPELDDDARYLERFNIAGILNNEIRLLNETHIIDLENWKIDASPLWEFNMQYFEYCIPLGVEYQYTNSKELYWKFKELLTSWIKVNKIGEGAAWHPYTISMRIPNWLICLELFGNQFDNDTLFKTMVLDSIYLQYRVLQKRQETWQLGNHYFENLKTIIICSILFSEKDIFEKYTKKFANELEEEICEDGMHFELSPMYHRIILEDLIRVCYLLAQKRNPFFDIYFPFLEKMTNALFTLEKGTRRVPLFNDSGEGVSRTKDGLLLSVKRLFNIEPKDLGNLESSGYYKLYSFPLSIVIDAGDIGPNYMPGHGHCDCLSYELFYNEIPIIVNCGTYEYQGEQRAFFRSSAAHNTVTINNHEQSEVWGEHRVGRRIKDINAVLTEKSFSGKYRNYLNEEHKRNIQVSDNLLIVTDETSGSAKSYLHLAPGFSFQDGMILGGGICARVTPINSEVNVEKSIYSYAFGKKEIIQCIVFSWEKDKKKHGYKIEFKENKTNG